MGTPAGFDPTKACFKRSRWFGKRHKADAFTKLGEPTIRCFKKKFFFFFFTGIRPSSSRAQ